MLLHHPTRRPVLASLLAAAATGPFSLPAPPASAAASELSIKEVNKRLGAIPVVAVVNEQDSPYFTSSEGATQVGYFFLDPTDALRELRAVQGDNPSARLKLTTLSEVYFPLVQGDATALGGVLRLRPSRRQIVEANRALQFNSPEGTLLPVSLSEAKGQVPLFYSERVALSTADGAATRYPFYLRKEDLDRDFSRLAAEGALQGGAVVAGDAALRSNSARRAARRAEREGGGGAAAVSGIPAGLTRVATLDGIVAQMRSGEVDLKDALLVPSPDALRAAQQLVAEGGGAAAAAAPR
ncbi:hypothetical protein EMIHUDRAFT_436483 [Emiliania huxleyi CCMP1516]|uniref:Uncharacterized protein n=2 Tax=Emiliania huxleyi TaxID=2903 RepID=A0A0D3IZY0_EMIH1|nr:hypothetical protein EMIHUDRAFT_436483 [Emiliania huxleyi CCMP1516]EOD16815.1 hypothetical protein EMIHUDRAFT_436483 [Emiliania huxleyi CCMP1516]|eukprot:XP_005769244.1 hypothetical protein EMIHUDRAFT_436483 [Emiliania huxleyi CCMP1516]